MYAVDLHVNYDLQVIKSAEVSRKTVEDHYEALQKSIAVVIERRKCEMLREIENAKEHNLEPLTACEDMIQSAMADATYCMEQGK